MSRLNLGDSLILDTDYSTSEVKTGATWIDRKPIYRKVVNTTLPTSITEGAVSNFDTQFSTDIDVIIDCYGYLVLADGSKYGLSRIWNGNGGYTVCTATVCGHVSSSHVGYVETASNRSSFSGLSCKVVVEYTKTTD